ncbi:MAG: TolC family outer membrane protein [Thiobacillaceae bacterium]
MSDGLRRVWPTLGREATWGLALLALSLPVQASDLLRIYQTAQANDPTFQAARHAFDAAAQKLPQARAGLLANASLNGNDGRTHASTEFSGVSPVTRDIRNWTWTLQLNQPVVHLENLYSYRESGYLVEQAQAQFEQARADLILRVAQAYFDVLVAQEAVTAADAQVSAMQEQLAQTQHGYTAGTSAVTDVDEAKSRFELARFQAVSAANELDAKRSELQKITGEWPGTLAGFQAAKVIPQPTPDDPQAWIGQAKNDNPAVHAQQAALKAAEAEISRSRSGHLPTLDLTASYGGNYSSDNLTNPVDYSTLYKSWQAGLQLAIPIYAGGATSSKVVEAMAKREQSAAELEAARRQAATDARQAFEGIKNGLAQVDALESALRSGQSAVKGNVVGYRVGLRINSDVLNAQQQVYTTLHDLAKARYDTLFQGLKLKAAAGNLSEADVGTINALLVDGK